MEEENINTIEDTIEEDNDIIVDEGPESNKYDKMLAVRWPICMAILS